MDEKLYVVKLVRLGRVGWFKSGKIQDQGPFSWSIRAEAKRMSKADADEAAKMMRILYEFDAKPEEA